jgi:E3 ubiquitin-protein ligase RNF14
MTCFQCRTHFCYLCSMWLDPMNPYKHFNVEGKPCYHRLWDLEEGDEGNGEVQFAGAREYEAMAELVLGDEEGDDGLADPQLAPVVNDENGAAFADLVRRVAELNAR